MNRRGFLQALGAGAVALALPGQRPHEWSGDKDICTQCGCTAIDVEDGRVPLNCVGTSRRIFLPARPRLTVYPYLTSETAWFIKPEHRDGLTLFNRSQESLERMLVQVSRDCDALDLPIAIKPTRLIVHPSWYGTEELKRARAKYGV